MEHKQLKALVKDLHTLSPLFRSQEAKEKLKLAVSYLKEIPNLLEALQQISECTMEHRDGTVVKTMEAARAEAALAEYKGKLPPKTNE